MAYVTIAEALNYGQQALRLDSAQKRSDSILYESTASTKDTDTFDIFLSHSILDAQIVHGIKFLFEKHRHTVYVDWIQDPQLNRSNVNKSTAEHIRKRMDQCKCLVYLTSSNSPNSRWMPWECGYKDGSNHKVAIFPLISTSDAGVFSRQEYLTLYPYVDEAGFATNPQNKALWVNHDSSRSELFSKWIN